MYDETVFTIIYTKSGIVRSNFWMTDYVMARVILAPKERLTPFDLMGQNFRVNVEFSTCHRGQKKIQKITIVISYSVFKLVLFLSYVSK